jgi:hypothetical protein
MKGAGSSFVVVGCCRRYRELEEMGPAECGARPPVNRSMSAARRDTGLI